MTATAKVFKNGRSQAIRLPKDFRVATAEVRLTRVPGGIPVTETPGIPLKMSAADYPRRKRADTPRKVAVKAAAARILRHCNERGAAGDVIALSAISAAELEYGLRHGRGFPVHAPTLRQLLAPSPSIPSMPPTASTITGSSAPNSKPKAKASARLTP